MSILTIAINDPSLNKKSAEVAFYGPRSRPR